MKKILVILLAVLVAAQLAVLAAMIRGQERILREGESFRFKTRPIDPSDPYRGRYIWLGFDESYIRQPKGMTTDLKYQEPVFASITNDAEGFAHFSGWSRERPTSGAYLKTRCLGEHNEWDRAGKSTADGICIAIPFDRYYMDEAKAPRAEQAVAEATRGTNCWAVVRILNGKAAIEDVYAKGQSIRALAAESKR